MMLRRCVPPLLLLLLCACGPPVEPFDFTLKLNLAGDEALVDELGLLQVDIVYPDGTMTSTKWDWFDATTALSVEDVEPADGVIFVVQGFVGPGDAVATGQSEPVNLYEETEAWVLFHRRGVFLELEGEGLDRVGHAVVPIEGGALIIGGKTSSGDFAPISKLVRTEKAGYALEDLPDPLDVVGMTATRIESGSWAGQVLIAGGGPDLINGFSDREVYGVYHVYDPVGEVFSIDNAVLESPRIQGTALALGEGNDGRVALIGGIEEANSGNILFAANVTTVDPDEGEVDSRTLNAILWLHSSVLWGPEVAVTCGSWDISGSSLVLSNTCIEYFGTDNSANTYSDVLQQARTAHASVLSGNNGSYVMLVGGTGTASLTGVPSITHSADALDTAEVLDPGNGYSSRTVSMNRARILPFAARLEESKQVLVCGGHDGTTMLADCELYDWTTDQFETSDTLVLPTAANWIQGAVLDDGSVLMVGGHAGNMVAANLGVLYIP